LVTNVMVYVPIVLAAKSISPVWLSTNTSPPVELKVPPEGLTTVGVGLVPVLQKVPEG
jgi:hypothetical protein